MTSIVSDAVVAALPATPGQALAVATGGIVALALVILMIARQLVEASGRPGGARIVRTLDIAVLPFLITFAVIVYERLQSLMPLG
jgi:uncharacterized membrane protein